MILRIASWLFFGLGAVVAFTGWLLLCFDAIYVASFPLSRLGGVLPGTLALIEAVVVCVLAYQYRKERALHLWKAMALFGSFSIVDAVFVVFFWGGL